MKNRITIYLAIIMIVLMSASIIVYLSQDHVAPVINVPQGEITYIEGQDMGVLLVGVTAIDDRDENISPDVRIYDIAVLDSGNQALVTYAVYDHSNNLGKATKLVNYIAREQDKKALDSDVNAEDEIESADKTEDSDKSENDKKTTEETTEETHEEPVE
ncbi:MAG: hypothetical protein IJ053_01940, partial [Lachnospiraceae bacterium]|nr:hypothetical protein [Lachnospiraceae bacterium]